MEIMGSSNRNDRPFVYDQVRLCWVKATPEELVRQQWLRWMIDRLQYPKELLVVEKEIKELPHLSVSVVPDRRVDILCYGRGIHPSHALYPLLMIECKEGRLTEKAIDQVIGYNAHVKAFFVAVVNLEEVRIGFFDVNQKKYEFNSVLPSFKELMQWVKP
jgi:hypothetical protein